MITYNKLKFNKLVISSLIILLTVNGILYTNGYIGENSIPYYKILLSFIITMTLLDPQTYLSLRHYFKNEHVQDIQSITYKYMVIMSCSIIITSTIIYLLSIKWFDGVFGVASVLYITTVLMTIIYNIGFKLSEIK